MANSDHLITRDKLVKRAFRRIGVSLPSTTEMINAVDLLNDIIKKIDEDGRFLWAINNTLSSLTTVASQRSYATGTGASLIATNILALEYIAILEGTTYTPLTIIGKEESLETVLKENSGKPVAAYLETAPILSNQKLHLFQTPDGAYSIKYNYRRRLYDFDNASDNPDFPQGWALRLTPILAYELSHEFGVPLQERILMKTEAQEAWRSGLGSAPDEADLNYIKTVYF